MLPKSTHGSAASTPIVPPMKQQTTTRICMIRFAAFPSRLSARIPADVDMDNAEDAAKRIRLMDARSLPGRPIVPNALIARTEPGSPVSHVPVTRMTIALNVQMIIVHINTSKIPNIPCLTGSFVFAWACRMLALPFPPSFEYTPLEQPFLIVAASAAPANPPVAAVPVNAFVKTEIRAGIRF